MVVLGGLFAFGCARASGLCRVCAIGGDLGRGRGRLHGSGLLRRSADFARANKKARGRRRGLCWIGAVRLSCFNIQDEIQISGGGRERSGEGSAVVSMRWRGKYLFLLFVNGV